MSSRITKIGGSGYLIVPAEYRKVYKLDKYLYSIKVSEDGKTLTYKRISKDEDISN